MTAAKTDHREAGRRPSTKAGKPSVHAAKTQAARWRCRCRQLGADHYQDDGSLLGDEGTAETDDAGRRSRAPSSPA